MKSTHRLSVQLDELSDSNFNSVTVTKVKK